METYSKADAAHAAGLSLDQRVDRLVVRISQHIENSALQTALAVGRLVIDGLYGGNHRAWKVRGLKGPSFRKLAQHPDLPMSATSLYRAVAAYEIVQRLGPAFPIERLTYSHFRVVLALHPQEQERLLQSAARDGWSVKRLVDEAAGQTKRSRGGRPRKPPLERALSQLESVTEVLLNIERTGLETEQRGGGTTADATADEVLRSLRQSRARIDALISTLHSRDSSCELD